MRSGRRPTVPPSDGRPGIPWSDIGGLVLDMDGVLWLGDSPLPGLDDLFAELRRLDLPYLLATNNSSRPAVEFVAKLSRYGVNVPLRSILTSAMATARVLADEAPGARLFPIGGEGLLGALAEQGFELAGDSDGPVRAVVVGYDRGLTYHKLMHGALLIAAGASFVATNSDVTFPSERGPLPGVGATLAALTAATGVSPRIVGKPERLMFDIAASTLGVPAQRLVMIGDRLATDILGARDAGLRSVLVTTGIDSADDIARHGIIPDEIASGLPAIVDRLRAVRPGSGRR